MTLIYGEGSSSEEPWMVGIYTLWLKVVNSNVKLFANTGS